MAEIMAAKTRIRTSGLLNWLSKQPNAVVWLPALNCVRSVLLQTSLGILLAEPVPAVCKAERSCSGEWLQ